MYQLRRKLFTAENDEQVAQALKRLEEAFLLREITPERFSETFCDTFDKALYAHGRLLKRSGKRLQLCNAWEEALVRGSVTGGDHFFAWEVEGAEMRDQLQAAATIRALSPLFSLEGERGGFELLNSDRKIVARLLCRKWQGRWRDQEYALAPLLRIEEIKGYEDAFVKTSQLLNAASLTELGPERSFVDCVLMGLGLELNRYSSKYSLTLDEEVTVQEAIQAICLYLVDAMETNYEGVIEDIDSEFLHDFRIAIRRTRSLLSQMKNFLPAEELVFFQGEFKWLGALTGPVRDIDVYLLKKEEYKAMLPVQLHQGLEEFFAELFDERADMLAQMHSGLGSARYRELLQRWQDFLDDDAGRAQWPGGNEPCRPVVKKAVRKRFAKIVKKGAAIDKASPDSDLHSLRIQGKKLRYMLEFFRSFYDEDDIEFFHRQLKKLQNNLGDFNDISVQLDMLEQYMGRLPARNKRSLRISSSLGGLITQLSRRHETVREKFAKTFSTFASAKNINKFHDTLA